MSSFISSFKFRQGWSILIVLLVALLLLEVATRKVLFRVSKDFSRFSTYPARAEELVQKPGLRVALIGNSATQRGVDVQILKDAFAPYEVGSVDVDMFVADGSHIQTWYFMLERYFWNAKRKPDLFVFNFSGNRGLADGEHIDIGRLAQFFTTTDDWQTLFASDLTSWSDRTEFVLSSGWATFAARQRIKDQALATVIPSYRDFATTVNDENQHHVSLRSPAEPATRQAEHTALKRLLGRAKEEQSNLCFVSFPCRDAYQIPAESLELLHSDGIPYVDLRHVDHLTSDMYEDDIHLQEAGRAVYSRRLAQALAPLVKKLGQQRVATSVR